MKQHRQSRAASETVGDDPNSPDILETSEKLDEQSEAESFAEKIARWSEFLYALVLSTGAPFIPVLISLMTTGETGTVLWMQTLTIYLLFIGATTTMRPVRRLASVFGFACALVYGLLEGGVDNVVKYDGYYLAGFLMVAAAATYSNIKSAYDEHVKAGRIVGEK